jgi:trigger factor
MKTDKKQISKNRIKISVTVEPEKMEEHFERQYELFAPTVAIAGFRPGKAPRAMTIEKIGHARLAQGALEVAINDAYQSSLREHKVYPVTQPAVSISKHPAFGEDKSQNELVFEIEFDILPEAKIGDYKKIKCDKIDPKKLEVADEEVEKVVGYLRRQAGQLKEKSGEVKEGDWVDVSFEGSIKGVVKDKLTSKNFPMIVGETAMIPGFVEQMVGSKKGDKKEFELIFPKDFADKEYAGAKVNFKLEVNDHKELILPKLDEEFVTKFGHKSIAELKKAIRESLEGEKKDRERQVQQAQISEQIIKITRVDIPKSLIDGEVSRMKQVLGQDLAQKGLTLEKYIENLKMTAEKMDKDLEAQAQRNIVLGVGLGEIAKKEEVEIGSAEGTKKVFERLVELCAK